MGTPRQIRLIVTARKLTCTALAVSFVGALDLIYMFVCDYRIIKLVFAVKVLQFAL